MTIRRVLRTFCAVLAWSGASALAQDPAPGGPPPVRIKPAALSVTAIHAYGGRPLAFFLLVQAPLGTRARVVADLVQTADHGAVAATLQRDVPVSAELVFDARTSLEAACRLPLLDPVKRITSMRLRLRMDVPGANPGDALVLPVTVFPAEEPDAWKKTMAARLTRAGVSRLAVFGEAKGLRRFLRARKVAFDDLGGDWPADPQPGTLYVADLPTSAPASRRTDESPGTRWLIFKPAEAAALPPGVYQRVEAGGGGVCQVTLPDLFEGIDERPDRLACLAEIFRLVLEPHPSETPP